MVILELSDNPQLSRDLAAGGVFAARCALELNADCELVVRGPAGELRLDARVVYVAPSGGAGLEIVGFNATLKDRLARLVGVVEQPEEEPAESPDELDGDGDADDRRHTAIPLNVQERLRGLTLAQQVKVAAQGTVNERVVLERLYGKNVWEPLLRNPRLTAPEVARMARMGTLPRIMLEVIVNNGAWLQVPEIRRALLGNPRLGTDQIIRVLRLLPKHEIKLAAGTTAYPFAVRDAAKKLLRSDG